MSHAAIPVLALPQPWGLVSVIFGRNVPSPQTTSRRRTHIAKRSLTLGPRVFPTKKAAWAHIQALLAHWVGRGPVHGEDVLVLRALMARHPYVEEKVGAGIAAVIVRPNPQFKHEPQLAIRRVDGTETAISW